jgi:hypothetical protein
MTKTATAGANAAAPAAPGANDLEYSFEAVGFVSTRRRLTSLEKKSLPEPKKMWASVQHLLSPLGFTGVQELYLTEDDAQANVDIKVFVVVKLKGPAGMSKSVKDIPRPLQLALDNLSDLACCTRGADRVGAENWELADSPDDY